jgi:hypothetical protein
MGAIDTTFTGGYIVMLPMFATSDPFPNSAICLIGGNVSIQTRWRFIQF